MQLRLRNPHVMDNCLAKWTVIICSNFQKRVTLHLRLSREANKQMNQSMTTWVIARYQSKHNTQTPCSWKFNSCEANFKPISVMQVEL